MWNSLLLEVDPTIAAVSSFLIGVTTAVLGASALLRGRGEAPGREVADHGTALQHGRSWRTRRRRACRAMIARGLDGLLLFRQESMYYLTGYDTSGYSMFQGMYLGADGALALCTRSADLRQARITSVIEDIRIWRDRQGATPGEDLRDMLESHRCRGKRLGVEYHAYGLTAQRGQMVDAALQGFCRTEDASDLVRLLRLVKSPAELSYVRRAGRAGRRGAGGGQPAHRAGPAPGADLRRDDEDHPGRRRRPVGQPVADGQRPRGPARPLPHRSRAHRPPRPGDVRVRRRLPPLPRVPHARGADRPRRPAPPGHVPGLPRGAHRLRGDAASRPDGRRRLRRPRPRAHARRATRSTFSTPAATRWARPTRRPGWTSR